MGKILATILLVSALGTTFALLLPFWMSPSVNRRALIFIAAVAVGPTLVSSAIWVSEWTDLIPKMGLRIACFGLVLLATLATVSSMHDLIIANWQSLKPQDWMRYTTLLAFSASAWIYLGVQSQIRIGRNRRSAS